MIRIKKAEGRNRLTKEVVPFMDYGIYELTIENETIRCLNELFEEGDTYFQRSLEPERKLPILANVRKHLQQHGIAFREYGEGDHVLELVESVTHCDTCSCSLEQGDFYIRDDTKQTLCVTCGKALLLQVWLLKGLANPWIKNAPEPFTMESFTACASIDELIEKFRFANWEVGRAFHLDQLCFIQQVTSDVGDEWLTFVNDTAVDSVSFVPMLKKHGKAYVKEFIISLLTQCNYRKDPDYTIVEAFV